MTQSYPSFYDSGYYDGSLYEEDSTGNSPGDSCGEDLLFDCDLSCIPADYLRWIGDGECDQSGGLNLNCAAFDFDGSDCDGNSSGSDGGTTGSGGSTTGSDGGTTSGGDSSSDPNPGYGPLGDEDGCYVCDPCTSSSDCGPNGTCRFFEHLDYGVCGVACEPSTLACPGDSTCYEWLTDSGDTDYYECWNPDASAHEDICPTWYNCSDGASTGGDEAGEDGSSGASGYSDDWADGGDEAPDEDGGSGSGTTGGSSSGTTGGSSSGTTGGSSSGTTGGSSAGTTGGSSSGSGGSTTICEETCSYAGDGVCDDGGLGATYDDCDYGSDCTDCGVRTVGGASSSGGSTSGSGGTSGSGSTSGTGDTGSGWTSGSGGTSADTGVWPSTCEDWDSWAPPSGGGSCADYESDPSRCSEDWSDVTPSYWPRPWDACCACGGGVTSS